MNFIPVQSTSDYSLFKYDENKVDTDVVDELARDAELGYLSDEPIIVDKDFFILKRVEHFLACKEAGAEIFFMVYESIEDDYILSLYDEDFYALVKTGVELTGLPLRLVAFILSHQFAYNTYFDGDFYSGEVYFSVQQLEFFEQNDEHYAILMRLVKDIKEKNNFTNLQVEELFFNILTYAVEYEIDSEIDDLKKQKVTSDEVYEYNNRKVASGSNIGFKMLFVFSLLSNFKIDCIQTELLEVQFKKLLKNNQLEKLRIIATTEKTDELYDKALDMHDESFFKAINEFQENFSKLPR